MRASPLLTVIRYNHRQDARMFCSRQFSQNMRGFPLAEGANRDESARYRRNLVNLVQRDVPPRSVSYHVDGMQPP